MQSLTKDQQCFLVDLLPVPLPILKTTQIQCDKGHSRLALRSAIADYHVLELKHKLHFLSRRCSFNHSTLRRYPGEVMMSDIQYR